MPTATYVRLPDARDLLTDIDGADDVFWDAEITANRHTPRRPRTPTTGPDAAPRTLVSADDVRALVRFPSAPRNMLRLAAQHPHVPADWVRGLLSRPTSATTCDLLHYALGNPHLDWDTARLVYTEHWHDEPVTFPSYPTSLRSTCTPVTLADTAIRNRAVAPDVVNDAIGTLTAHPGFPDAVVLACALSHRNASASVLTAFVDTLLDRLSEDQGTGNVRGFHRRMKQLRKGSGYAFGEDKEYNAGGRVTGSVDRWYSMRLVDAATD